MLFYILMITNMDMDKLKIVWVCWRGTLLECKGLCFLLSSSKKRTKSLYTYCSSGSLPTGYLLTEPDIWQLGNCWAWLFCLYRKKQGLQQSLLTLINVKVPYTVVYNFSINCFHSPKSWFSVPNDSRDFICYLDAALDSCPTLYTAVSNVFLYLITHR